MVRVRKFRHDPCPLQKNSQVFAGIAEGLWQQAEFQRLLTVKRPSSGSERSFQGLHLPRCLPDAAGVIASQKRIHRVQRLEDQVRGAGTGKEGQGLLRHGQERFGTTEGEMQPGPARQHREGLVGGVTAEIRALIQRVPGGREKSQIGAVGVVHQKQSAVAVAELRVGRKVQTVAQIIGTGEIDRGGGLFGIGEELLQLRERGDAGEQGRAAADPAKLQVQ